MTFGKKKTKPRIYAHHGLLLFFSVALRWRIFVSFCSFLWCCCCFFPPDFSYCSFFFNHLFSPFPLRVWFRQRAYTYNIQINIMDVCPNWNVRTTHAMQTQISQIITDGLANQRIRSQYWEFTSDCVFFFRSFSLALFFTLCVSAVSVSVFHDVSSAVLLWTHILHWNVLRHLLRWTPAMRSE